MVSGTQSVASSAPAADQQVTRLRPVLTLWDLIFYGIVVIMPIAALPLFGVAQQLSAGHAVTTLLVGMVTMMFTAVSYGRMAARYPTAGSAYTYVSAGLHPYLGFLGGWAMFLMYLAVPISCVVYGSVTMQRVIPQIPFPAWVLLFAGVMTFLNQLGIRSTARTNIALLVFMCTVIVVFIGQAIAWIVHRQGVGGLFSLAPFYGHGTFKLETILMATSFSAFTYVGFDSPTTLAEDVRNPRRNLLLAPVLVCIFTGLFSGLQVYLGQRVWPQYHNFPNVETAFMDVSRRVGGTPLFFAMWAILIAANLGSGLGGQVGAARLLFGMGRDNVLPRRIFGAVNLKRNTPVYNLWIIGALMFFGSLFLSYERIAEVLNFGAFVIFMGVNLAALRVFWFTLDHDRRRNFLSDALAPLIGFVLCLWIWWSLPHLPKVIGAIWMAIGFAYEAVTTHGFTSKPIVIDFREAN